MPETLSWTPALAQAAQELHLTDSFQFLACVNMSADLRFVYDNLPTPWRTGGKQFVQGTDFMTMEANHKMDVRPLVLRWDLKNNHPLLFDWNTRFAVEGEFQTRDTEEGDWRSCTPADSADVMVAPNWWGLLIKRMELSGDGGRIRQHHEPEDVGNHLDQFLYWGMDPLLKKQLCNEECHPGNAHPSSKGDWTFDPDETVSSWQKYSKSIFVEGPIKFHWMPQFFFPLYQGSNHTYDQGIQPRCLPTPHLGGLQVRMELHDNFNFIFKKAARVEGAAVLVEGQQEAVLPVEGETPAEEQQEAAAVQVEVQQEAALPVEGQEEAVFPEEGEMPAAGQQEVVLPVEVQREAVAASTKQYRFHLEKVDLICEEVRLDPEIEKKLYQSKKKLSFLGVTKNVQAKNVKVGDSLQFLVRFEKIVRPDSVLIYVLPTSVINDRFKFSDWNEKEPFFLQHNIEAVNFSCDGKPLTHSPIHLGIMDDDFMDLKRMAQYEKLEGPFGLKFAREKITRANLKNGWGGTDFPHVYVKLGPSSGEKRKQDFNVFMKFNKKYSVPNTTYVVTLIYTGTNMQLDMKEKKFENPIFAGR